MPLLKPILCLLLCLSFSLLSAQEETAKPKLYHPEADAKAEIAQAVAKAKAEGKHVFLQMGGNWCIWCLRFHDFAGKNAAVDSLFKANYVVVHVNYSPENRNEKILAKYGYPQRMGFPVFVILDASGKRLHTQDSWFLEDGKQGYDLEKTKHFLESWSPAALKAENNKG